jgi:hypothetical protein
MGHRTGRRRARGARGAGRGRPAAAHAWRHAQRRGPMLGRRERGARSAAMLGGRRRALRGHRRTPIAHAPHLARFRACGGRRRTAGELRSISCASPEGPGGGRRGSSGPTQLGDRLWPPPRWRGRMAAPRRAPRPPARRAAACAAGRPTPPEQQVSPACRTSWRAAALPRPLRPCRCAWAWACTPCMPAHPMPFARQQAGAPSRSQRRSTTSGSQRAGKPHASRLQKTPTAS